MKLTIITPAQIMRLIDLDDEKEYQSGNQFMTIVNIDSVLACQLSHTVEEIKAWGNEECDNPMHGLMGERRNCPKCWAEL